MEYGSAWYRYFAREVPNFVLRCICNVVGICLVACGVALAKLSTTGTSAISCMPAVISDIFAWFGYSHITLGMTTFIFNALLLVVQVILLKKDFPPIQLLQLALVFAFGWAIDQWMVVWAFIPLPNYAARLAMLLASAATVALGVFIEVKGNILLIPGEAVVYTISHVARIPFHRCKVMFDVTMIVSAALLSLAVMHGLYDVREGSIFSALAIGNLVKMWSKIFNGLDAVVPPARRNFIKPIIPALRYTIVRKDEDGGKAEQTDGSAARESDES